MYENDITLKKDKESSLAEADSALKLLINKDQREVEAYQETGNYISYSSDEDRLSDTKKISLRDFIWDLKNGCTFKKKVPIVKGKFSIKDLLPSEWLAKYQSLKGYNQYITHLNMGDTNDYKIGNDIYKMFLSDPKTILQQLKDHLNNFEIEKESFNYYFDCLFSYDYAVGYTRRIDKYMCRDIRDKDLSKKITEKYSSLLQHGLYNEIMANLILCIILGAKEKTKENKYISLLIWFSEDEITDLVNTETSIDGIRTLPLELRYHYAKSFYDRRRYDVAYRLVEKANLDKVDIISLSASIMLSKLRLFGRGCDSDVFEACEILEKCICKITHNTTGCDSVKSEILLLLTKIYIGTFSQEKYDTTHGTIIIPDTQKAERYYEEYKMCSSSNREIIPSLESNSLNISKQKISFKNKIRMDAKDIIINGNYTESNYCISNSLIDLKCTLFIDSLNGFEIREFKDELSISEAISAMLISNKKVIFAFFSDDNSANLNDCLMLLDRLYNLCLSNSDKTDRIINNISIFVDADYDFASMMIDASLSDMDEIYFQVHICDYNREAAHKLLTTVPLFADYSTNSVTNNSSIVVMGCNALVYKLIKEITAVSCLPKLPSITVLDKNADFYESQYKCDCPGIYNSPDSLRRIIPHFLSCDVNKVDFPNIIFNRSKSGENSDIVNVLLNGTYFIIDIGSDEENILFATKLRSWLLQSDNSFSKSPTIVVKCENRRNAYLLNKLTLQNKPSGENFYNNYNIKCFGVLADIYNYQYLLYDEYKSKAYKVHCLYSQGCTQTEINNSYYSFSYNRDSSTLQIISILYELNEIGILESSDNLTFDSLSELFISWIRKPGNDKIIAAIEHNRWNGYMLSRGWQSATYEQVMSYTNAGQQSGSDHKHLLAKLHPFICDWSILCGEDDPEKIAIINLLLEKFPSLKSPIQSTYNIASHISDILSNKSINLVKKSKKSER